MRFNLDEAIVILERTPGVLSNLLKDLPSEWIMNNEGEETWSPYIIGHLIHGEETDWVVRAEILLNNPEKPFHPFDRFAQFEKSKGKTLDELLGIFSRLREDNLIKLKSLG